MDKSWQKYGLQPIVGVDEVGRGCLAGPVYAAAVILDERLPFEDFRDSKSLSKKEREILAKCICEQHTYGIGFATEREIETMNILQASLKAMERAVLHLKIKEGTLLIDGKFTLSLEGFRQKAFCKGDQRFAPIAAASIVAKVTRDQYMEKLEEICPQYAFKKHKGYGTPLHRKKIEEHGPSSHHRRSFKGVKEYL